MPHFQRQAEPFVTKSYSAYRPAVRADFRQQCAYCLIHELLGHGEESYELDHFKPKHLFPELLCAFLNIYYACHACNHIKSGKWPTPELQARGFRFVDLCSEDFEEHFEPATDGEWKPLTPAGAFTLEKIRLNRPHLVEARQILAGFGIGAHELVDGDALRLQLRQPS